MFIGFLDVVCFVVTELRMLYRKGCACKATVSLFIQDSPAAAASKTFFLISLVKIPSGTSLLLDDASMFSFSNSSPTGFGLYATVGSTDTVDILIN